MQGPRCIKVSKLDAAKRQLDTAIALWFADKDPVSIHALSSNAQQIVTDILKGRGVKDIALDSMVKEEYREEANRLLRGPMNFIKHGSRDAGQILEFRPALSEGFIILAIYGLRALGETLSQEQHAFSWYMSIHKPHLLNDEGHQLMTRLPAGGLKALRGASKLELLEIVLTAFAQNKLKR